MKLPFALPRLPWRRGKIQPYKRGLLLQWHVTHRCGQRCAHCYQDGYDGPEMDLADLLSVLEQYKRLLATLKPARGHVTITGGEPFARADIWDLLQAVAANDRQFSFAILSNGQYIDKEAARRLKKLNPRFVQLSVEGEEWTHDKIRGPGDYARVVQAIGALHGAGVATMISFTAHAENYREFPAVARLGRQLGVGKVWTDRLIPCGSGAAVAPLDAGQTEEYINIVAQQKRQGGGWFRRRSPVAADRALQFIAAGGKPYRCVAGDNLITIMPDGTLYPCRRMPAPVGNVMRSSLLELYHGQKLLRDLRDRSIISQGCRGCIYQRFCAGGLKCLSWAATGDPFRADPGCPLAGKGEGGGTGLIL